jgi:hypothetical protein
MSSMRDYELEQSESRVARAIAPRGATGSTLESPPPSSLADLGVTVTEEHARTLRAWLETIRPLTSGATNVTFMDATCMETARDLIGGQPNVVAPLGLLDLGTFVTAYCTFDRIVFLHNDMFGATELKSFDDEVFVEIPVETTQQAGKETIGLDVRPALYDVYLHTVLPRIHMLYGGDPPGLAQAMHDGWRTLLGADPGNLYRELHEQFPFSKQGTMRALTPDLDTLSRALTRDVNGDQHFLESFSYEPASWKQDDLHIPVAESNGRAIFNMALCEMLRLPYSSSAGRLPYRRYLYQQAKRRDAALARRIERSSPDVVRFIEQHYDSLLGRLDTTSSLDLPPFLAAVLAQVTRPSEIPEAMADLRRQARPFRARLEELNACVKSGVRDRKGVKGVHVMLKALQDDAALFRRKAIGSAAVKGAAALAGLSLPNSAAPWEAVLFLASAAGIAALADLVDREFLERLERRLFRREYWFLTRLGSSLRAATGGWDRVQQIWAVEDRHQEFFSRRFAEIARLRYI